MASTGVLNGTDILVYCGGTAIGHATSHSLNLTLDERDTTTKSSSGWKEILPALRSWTIDASGFVAYDDTYTFEELFALYSGRTSVVLKFSTEVTGDNRYTGTAYLSSLNKEAPLEDNVTYSVSFTGTSTLTEEAVT